MVRRAAFTLIELIMAIVIMGIVFISLPTILLSTSQQSEQNLIQEGVFLSAAQMSQVLSWHWDNNSPDLTTTLAKADAIDTPSGDPELDRQAADSDFRIGHFIQPLHRRMSPADVTAARSASAIGNDAEFNDIDDFDGQTLALSVAGGTAAQSYKNDYNITTTVRYVTDNFTYSGTTVNAVFNDTAHETGATAAASATNIKRIVISTAKDGNEVVRLHAYSTNVGETDYFRRTF